MLRFFFYISFLFITIFLNAQHYYYGNNLRLYGLESKVYQSANNVHSITKPYNYRASSKVQFSDSLFQKGILKYGSELNTSKAIFLPVVDADFKLSSKENNAYLSTGFGLQCDVNLHPKISLFSRYIYRSGQVSEYVRSSIHNRGTVRGIGNAEDSIGKFKIHDFDFNLSAVLSKYFLVSFGNGKNFWGDGHRSLLLSDFAPSYPYIRIESEFWKIKYTNLYSAHRDHYYFDKKQYKFSSSHLLSCNILNGLNFSVFESVVWAAKDSLNRRNFDVNYLNPIIFFRPIEYNIGSSDNSFFGVNLKATIFKKHILYSQLILDEFLLEEIRNNNGWWANKYGFQFGYKSFDLFEINGLGFQLEFNSVRPFTYSHLSSLQNYGNANHSLAHPLESNFREFLTRVIFQRNNLSLEFTYAFQQHGGNASGNFGGDMFFDYSTRLGDYNHTMLQGDLTKQHYFGFNSSYLLVAKTNTILFTRIDFRNTSKSTKNNNLLFSFGIKSNVWNSYLDY